MDISRHFSGKQLSLRVVLILQSSLWKFSYAERMTLDEDEVDSS